MKLKEKIIVLDCETTNDIDCPLTYDIGFQVCDYEGNVYATFSYVVADVFLDKSLMESAYFIDKIPQYKEDLANGVREMRTLKTIRDVIRSVCKLYNVKKVFAYNCRFDYKATNNTERYITKSKIRFFFPYGTKFYDILKLARIALKDDTIYREFCVANDYVDKRNCNRHTAEIVYRYWFDKDFVEEHCGLEDCKIEYQLLLKCLETVDVENGLMW